MKKNLPCAAVSNLSNSYANGLNEEKPKLFLATKANLRFFKLLMTLFVFVFFAELSSAQSIIYAIDCSSNINTNGTKGSNTTNNGYTLWTSGSSNPSYAGENDPGNTQLQVYSNQGSGIATVYRPFSQSVGNSSGAGTLRALQTGDRFLVKLNTPNTANSTGQYYPTSAVAGIGVSFNSNTSFTGTGNITTNQVCKFEMGLNNGHNWSVFSGAGLATVNTNAAASPGTTSYSVEIDITSSNTFDATIYSVYPGTYQKYFNLSYGFAGPISSFCVYTVGVASGNNPDLYVQTLTLSGTDITSTTALPDVKAITFEGSTAATISGNITQGSNANTNAAFVTPITIASTNTITLTGAASTYTGTTTLTTGTLQLGVATAIPTTTTQLILNGGTLKSGATTGFSDNMTATTLQLNNNSTIALGTGVHTIKFSASNALTWVAGKTITITGWTGTAAGATGTAGQIFVGSASGGLTSGQLSQIVFSGGTINGVATQLSSGEIVPAALPTVVSPTATSITPTSALLSATISVSATNVTSYGTAYNTPGAVTLLTNPNTVTTTVSSFPFVIPAQTASGLTPQTLYNYAGYATNSAGTSLGTASTFYTLSNTPTSSTSALTATATSTSNINLSWTAASFPATGSTKWGYLLLQNTGSTPTLIASPNGLAPASVISTGTIVATTATNNGTAPAVTASSTGLSSGTKYYYTVVPYTWDGTNPGTYNYYTATAPFANATTLVTTIVATTACTTGPGSVGSPGLFYDGTPASASDPLWSIAPINTITNITDAGGTTPTAGSYSTWQALFDATYLYVKVNVTDLGHFTNPSCSGTAYQNDAVDLFFDGGTTRAGTDNVNAGQSTYSRDCGSASTLFGPNSNTGYGATAYYSNPTNPAGGANVPDNYVEYIQVPWTSISNLPVAKYTSPSVTGLFTMGFDVDYGDAQTTNTRNNQMAWVHTTDPGYNNPASWGYAALTVCAPPSLSVPSASAITATTATLTETVTALNGGGTLVTTGTTNTGIQYSTSPSFSPDAYATVTGTPTVASPFTASAASLAPQTKYYFQGFGTRTNFGTSVTGVSTSNNFYTLSAAPTGQAAGFTTSAPTTSSLNLNLTTAATYPASPFATKTGYILIYSIGTPAISATPNGQAPASVITTGTQITVTEGAAPTAPTFPSSATGLAAGTTYNFLLVPYTWDGTNSSTYNYLTTSAATASGTTTALATPIPTVTTTITGTITSTNALIGGSGISGTSITAEGTVYGTATNPTGNIVVSSGSTGASFAAQSIGVLAPQTSYTARAYADNTAAGGGIGYGPNFQFYTLSAPPTGQAAGLATSSPSTTSLNISLSTAATFTATGANKTGYLLLYSIAGTPTLVGSPNGLTPALAIATGTRFAITDAIAPTAPTFPSVITGLSSNQIYYFLLVPYTWDGTNTGTYNYLTTSAPFANGTTLQIPPTVTNTTAAGSITSTSATSGGSGISGPSITDEGTVYGTTTNPTGNILSSGTTGASFGPTSISSGSLTPQTQYFVRAYATNTGGTAYGNNVSFYTFSTLPLTPASAVTVSSVSSTTVTLNIGTPATYTAITATKGGYVVIYSTGTPNTTGLVNGAAPTSAGGTFYQPATATLSGNPSTVNPSSVVTVPSLSSGTTYNFIIVPYTWDGTNAGTYDYSTPTASVPGTPVDATIATDYFRSVITGKWSNIATWQSSHTGNNPWISATSIPTSSAVRVEIQGTTGNLSGTNGPAIIVEYDVLTTTTIGTNGISVVNGGALILDSLTNLAIGTSTTFTVNGMLNCKTGSIVSGAGNFQLNPYSCGTTADTLAIGDPNGITTSGATGSIQNTGGRNFYQAAFMYNCSAAGTVQITGTGLPNTVQNLIINRSTTTDIVSLTNNNTTIAQNSCGGFLVLNKGIFKVGSTNILKFTSSGTNGGIQNPNATGTSNIATTGVNGIDGGTITFASASTFTVSGPGLTTFYNLNANTGSSIAIASANTVLINGTLTISTSSSGLHMAPATNSPIYSNTSTLFVNWNSSNYTPGLEWNATSGYSIGVTAGYPNNVTIVGLCCGQTATVQNNANINGVLTYGDGTVNNSSLSFNPSTTSNFSCGGIVINAGYTFNAPSTGTITVNGNWLRSNTGAGGASTFNPGTGSVIFAGAGTCAAPNTIAGPTSETFYNMTVNNGAYVSLNSAVNVTNIFTLPTAAPGGILTTTSSNILKVTNTSVAGITGGYSGAFVNGPLSWTLANTTTNSYVFPVGGLTCPSTTTYLPLTLAPKNAQANNVATVQGFASSSGGSGTNQSLSTTEYWKLGTSSSFTAAGSLISVTRPSAIASGSTILQAATANSGSYATIGGTVSGTTSIINGVSTGTSTPMYFAISNFGDYASAVFLKTTASPAGSYYTTTGTGADLIDPTLVFSGTNLGTYTANSGLLQIAGGQQKFHKNGGNVCSDLLWYAVYPTGSRPASPFFTSVNIPFASQCSGGAFPDKGPCSVANNDQKWNQQGASVDLTTGLSPANCGTNYTVEVYYQYTGDPSNSGGCGSTFTTNNNNNPTNYTANFVLTSGLSWTGATNSDWNNTGNWCTAQIPGATTNVIIPSAARYPIISNALTTNASVNSITINSGASLTVGTGGILNIFGNITNNGGTFDATAGTIQMKGSAVQTIAGANFVNQTIYNLRDSNTVSITSPAGLTVDSLNIVRELGFLNTGVTTLNITNKLVLLSTATGTAFVAPIKENGSGVAQESIIGNVIVQRFFPAHRRWRFITAPIKAAGLSINAAWQEGGVNTLTPLVTQDFAPTYGTFITGGTAANGYDQTAKNSPSIATVNGLTTWNVLSSTLSTMVTDNQGYMLFVRGSRAIANYPIGSQYVYGLTGTLRNTGTINTGQVTIPLTASGVLAVGNPYAAVINFNSVYSHSSAALSSNSYYLWVPNRSNTSNATGSATGNDLGGWVGFTYSSGNGNQSIYTASVAGTSAGLSDPGSSFDLNGDIESGAAFLVNSSGGGNLIIHESDKDTTASVNNNTYNYRPSAPSTDLAFFRTSLIALAPDNSDAYLADGALNLFSKSFTNEVNMNKDLPKMSNIVCENLGIKTAGKLLCIRKSAPVQAGDTLQLDIVNLRTQTYKFTVTNSNFYRPDLQASFIDKYKNTATPVKLGNDTTNVFVAVDGKIPASIQSNRFAIVFKTAPGSVTFTNVTATATAQNKNINVQWTVNNELNIKQYLVEKSTDGINYSLVNTTPATANSNGTFTYNWADVNPVIGDNYYKIISVDNTGATQASNPVDAVITKGILSGIAIYPNPVINGEIGLQMNNVPAGTYGINVIDAIGQVVLSTKIEHGTSSELQTIYLSKGYSKGQYILQVKYPNNTLKRINFLNQ